jgi:SSS family solute:Na+ symporter
MAVSGAIYFTGAFAVLLLGLYWKRASRTGAYLALGAGMLAVLGLGEVRTTVSVIATYLGAGHGIVWFESLGADVIGLSTAALALGGMFVGSIFFPDKSSTLRANQGDADVPR